jgi:hypothetical protein
MPATLTEIRERFRRKIREVIASRADLTYAEIGAMFGVTSMTVWGVAHEYGLRRKRGPKPKRKGKN